jgi:hypothetical protein
MSTLIESPIDLDQQLDELEIRLDRLRALYEQYFLGIEKRPPSIQHKEVARIIRLVSTYQIKQSRSKFRYQSLIQRFNVHNGYWVRTCRQIEEGSYSRHRARINRRESQASNQLNTADLAKQASVAKLKDAKAVIEGKEQRASQQAVLPYSSQIRGTPSSEVRNSDQERASSSWEGVSGMKENTAHVLDAAGISKNRAETIFETLISARKEHGESTDNLTFERVVHSMAKQIPKIRKTHESSSVDFNVVTKNNKVYLKPVPK